MDEARSPVSGSTALLKSSGEIRRLDLELYLSTPLIHSSSILFNFRI